MNSFEHFGHPGGQLRLPRPARPPSRAPVINSSIHSRRESFPDLSYLKECHVVSDPAAAVGGDASDDGLWAPEKREAPRKSKSDEEPWVVPEAIKGEVPHKSAELAREGANTEQGFFSFALVVLAVMCGAVFVVWKKNKKDRRRRES